MKSRFTVVILLALLLGGTLYAQPRYWVYLRDKDGVEFDPYSYFDVRTLEKRANLGIPLATYDDLPLRKLYVDQLEEIAPVAVQSRWMNAVSMQLSPKELNRAEKLTFVKEIRKIEVRSHETGRAYEDVDPEMLLHIARQRAAMGASWFEEEGIDGSGVRIAVLDGGFPGVDELPVFQRIRDEGRIIATYDFVKKQEFVYDYSSHGTNVLACIAGELDGVPLGLGTGAEFLLARTEVKAEVYSEEENWAAAAEWADKNGADIINSSLGYTYHRYFPRQMDGKYTFISRMANRAARKGILVINAAGNDGDNEWQVIGAPADADSVLSVGGISSQSGIHSEFSSFGPTFDGRMKPNVVAFSDVITAGRNGLTKAYGTSFAAPLVTGFAACVKQLHPEWGNMKLFEEICKSGHLYPYFDYAHGYGIPQAQRILGVADEREPTFTLNESLGELTIKTLTSDDFEPEKASIYLIEPPQSSQKMTIITQEDENGDKTRLVIAPPDKPHVDEQVKEQIRYKLEDDYLYYHIVDPKTNKVRKYRVVNIGSNANYTINLSELRENEVIRIFYKGYTTTYSK